MKQGVRAMPILPVGDVTASADWFRDRLGFDVAGAWKDDDGTANFSIVALGTITIGLTRSDRAPSGEDWAAYCYVEDIAAFADHILGKGTKVLRGPENSFYGCCELEVEEPSGNRLCFAQDLRPGPDGPGL